MNSDTESSYEWNTVNNRKKKRKDNDMSVFFKKIKKELDEEFHFLHKKDEIEKKNTEEKKEIQNKPKNIFSLLLSDSE